MAKSIGNITVIMNRRGARGCVQSHSLFLKKMIDKPVFYDRVKDALLWSSMDY